MSTREGLTKHLAEAMWRNTNPKRIARWVADPPRNLQAVLAVLDAEVAAAVSEAQAEVARLTILLDSRNRVVEKVKTLAQNWQARALPAESEAENLREGIRALADEWESYGPTDVAWHWDRLAGRVRALLTPPPPGITGRADEPATGEACGLWGWLSPGAHPPEQCVRPVGHAGKHAPVVAPSDFGDAS